MALPASLRSFGLLDVSNRGYACWVLSRKPCIQNHLGTFASKAGEKSGLSRISHQLFPSPSDRAGQPSCYARFHLRDSSHLRLPPALLDAVTSSFQNVLSEHAFEVFASLALTALLSDTTYGEHEFSTEVKGQVRKRQQVRH